MRFIKIAGKDVVDVEMSRRSVYVMQDDARYKWHHSVPSRKKDTVDGNVKHRGRRLSITYRKVIGKKVKPINPGGKVAKMLQDHFNINSTTLRGKGSSPIQVPLPPITPGPVVTTVGFIVYLAALQS